MRRSTKAALGGAVLAGLVAVMILGPASGATREEKREQIQSNLKNAATAEESYRTQSPTYTRLMTELEDEGLDQSRNVRLLIVRAGKDHYCLEAQHDGLGEIWKYSSRVGRPVRGRC